MQGAQITSLPQFLKHPSGSSSNNPRSLIANFLVALRTRWNKVKMPLKQLSADSAQMRNVAFQGRPDSECLAP